MFKQEILLREILCLSMNGMTGITQSQLSTSLRISLGMVNKTILKLRRMGSVRINTRNFNVIDCKRLLLYWATIRNIERDVVYSTRANLPVKEIERSLPPGAMFTAYSGVKLSFGEIPSDYSEVWVYADDVVTEEIQRRFKKITFLEIS